MKAHVRLALAAAFTLATVISLVTGCASAPRPGGKRGTLQGMIYDSENAPVCGYLVSVDGREKAYTDINGRFAIPDIDLGTHVLSGEGRDHGPYAGTVDFADRTQILSLRIPSNRFLYAQIDRQLGNGEYGAAQKTLLQFSKEEQKNKKYHLYRTITLFYMAPEDSRSGYYAKARKLTGDVLDE